MTEKELASRIDHTLLKPEASGAEIERVIAEARRFGFASVCVQPVHAARVRAGLAGSGVKTCAVIGFPHGANRPTVKAIEATAACKDGCDEIDVVGFLPALVARDVYAVKAELMEVVRGARAANPRIVVKVIVESAVIVAGNRGAEEAAIADACRAVRESGADFIKTSTGYHPAGGASVDVVGWMKKFAEGLKVKASGGIRDLAAARAMLEAGADRLGLSAGVAILGELSGGSGPTSAGGY